MPVFKFNLYADDVYVQAQEVEADTAQDAVDKVIEGYERGEYLYFEERYDCPGDVIEVRIIDNETDDVLLEYTPPDKAAKMAGPDLLDALVSAEAFVSGFEGDNLQEGITALLEKMRSAIKKAGGSYGA